MSLAVRKDNTTGLWCWTCTRCDRAQYAYNHSQALRLGLGHFADWCVKPNGKRTRATVARCGTDGGYFAHIRAGHDACRVCVAAHAHANRGWERRRNVPPQHIPCRNCGVDTRTGTCASCGTAELAAKVAGSGPRWVMRKGVWRAA